MMHKVIVSTPDIEKYKEAVMFMPEPNGKYCEKKEAIISWENIHQNN